MLSAGKDGEQMSVTKPSRATASQTVVWKRPAPAALRSLSPLTRVDYSDVVVGQADPSADRTPEQWAQVMLGGLPAPLRAMIPVVQRALLGLRLQLRPAPDRLLGWKIAERQEQRVRIEAEGRLIAANVVVSIDEGRVSFATFVRYDNALAAVVWPVVSLLHRRVAILLVRAAVTAD
jgi:hypothetical protein